MTETNLNKQILIKIPLFKETIKIKKLNIISRCKEKYRVLTKTGDYFVKIENSIYTKLEIEKVKWLYKTYIENKISVVPLIDIMVIENKTIWVFPFFEGKTLYDRNFSLEEFYNYGKMTAKDIKKLNKIKPNTKLFHRLDMFDHFQERKQKVESLINNPKTKRKLLKIFLVEEWNRILAYYEGLYNNIKEDKIMLNHNDIKLQNILIDKNKEYYFIDIDPFDLTIIGYNVGYSISSFLFQYKENEKSFLRGFIQEIDSNQNLIKQMNYFIISDFINKLENNYKEYQKNSRFIKQILLNDSNALINELYDIK